MTENYRIRLEQYLMSLIQIKQWRDDELVSSKEYAKIDTILTEKYGLSSCNIYRGIDLLYGEVRGNMRCEEAI